MIHVVVLAGGTSDERAVSLRSGAAVAKALQTAGYNVRLADPSSGFNTAELAQADVVFPVVHGTGGEDGALQRSLEATSKPYVGSGVAASELCFDKWLYRQFLQTSGAVLPEGELVDSAAFLASPLAQQAFVLKPPRGGSSIDTYIYRGGAPLDQAKVLDLFSRHPSMLLEQLIAGTEITVGVLGKEALPVIEIVPPEAGEFDYANKYNGKTRELCPPETVSKAIQDKAERLAERIHQLCGCRDFSRSDMIVADDGTLYLLETNTIPGMTDQSLLPKAAVAAGMTMPALCDRLVRLALDRKA